MSNVMTHMVTVLKTDARRWIAVSYREPFFCFEGNSAKEVKEIARRALNYYFGCLVNLYCSDAP